MLCVFTDSGGFTLGKRENFKLLPSLEILLLGETNSPLYYIKMQ